MSLVSVCYQSVHFSSCSRGNKYYNTRRHVHFINYKILCALIYHLKTVSKLCLELRVHPDPCVHIFATGCTIFRGVHPESVCFYFVGNLSLLHIWRVHGEIPGCTVLGEVHLVGAQ